MLSSSHSEAPLGKAEQPLTVLVHVKWLGSNKPFTTAVLGVCASNNVDGASHAAMLQQKLAPLMPESLMHSQVCVRANTGAALTMHPRDLKDYLNAFEFSSRPPKTAAQKKLDEAWDALLSGALRADVAADASASAAPVTVFATLYSSVDCAVAFLQMKRHNEETKQYLYTRRLDQATRDNPRVVLCCIDQHIPNLQYSDKANASKRVVLKRLLQGAWHSPMQSIGAVPEHVLRDKQVSQAVLTAHGWDPECLTKYNLSQDTELLKYAQVMFDVNRRKLHKPASTYSRHDVLERVKMNGNAIKLHVSYTDDKEVVLAAASCTRDKLSYRFLAWLEPDMQDDEDVVYAAVQNGASLEHASTKLQGNLRVARAAVAHTASDLAHVSDDLRKHRGLVLAACKRNGMALQYAHESFRSDKEVVLAACRSKCLAVQFVAPTLRNNESVFIAACTQPGEAWSFMIVRKYVHEFIANCTTTTTLPTKLVKLLIARGFYRVSKGLNSVQPSTSTSATTAKLLVTKSMVMWFIKTTPAVAVTFFEEHSIGHHLDFACKCVCSNWKAFVLLKKHKLLSNHKVHELLRAAAVASFGPAKAAAAHWME